VPVCVWFVTPGARRAGNPAGFNREPLPSTEPRQIIEPRFDHGVLDIGVDV